MSKLVTYEKELKSIIDFKLLNYITDICTVYEDKGVVIDIEAGSIGVRITGNSPFSSLYNTKSGYIQYHPSKDAFSNIERNGGIYYKIRYHFNDVNLLGDNLLISNGVDISYDIYKNMFYEVINKIRKRYNIEIDKSFHPYTAEEPYTNNYLIFKIK